jgi:hypothetical protein
MRGDRRVIEHIRRHSITPAEVEELLGSKLYRRKRGAYLDLLGKTRSGRVLFVVLERVEAYRYRVAIARDATSAEKDLYVKRGK